MKGHLYSYKGSDLATMSHDDIQLMYAAGRQINEKGNASIKKKLLLIFYIVTDILNNYINNFKIVILKIIIHG